MSPRSEEWYSATMEQAIESSYAASGLAPPTPDDLDPVEVLLAWIGAQLRDLLTQREEGDEWKGGAW